MAELNKFRIQLKDLNGQLMFPNTTASQVSGLDTVINNAITESLKTTSVMSFQGTIGGASASLSALPAVAYKGFTYMVAEAGTYADQECEVGDLIICTGNNGVDGTEPTESYWTVVQTNLTGAVSGSFGNNAEGHGKLVITSGEHAVDVLESDFGSEYAGVYVLNGKFKETTQTYAAFQVEVEDENTLSLSVFDYDPAKGFQPIDVDKKVTGKITSPDKSVQVNWKKVDGEIDPHTVEIKIGTAVTERIEKIESDVLTISSQVVLISSKVDEVEQKIDAKIAESNQGGSAYGTIAGLKAGNSSDTITLVAGAGLVLATSASVATGTRLVDGEEVEYEYQTNQTITVSLNLSTGLKVVDGKIAVDNAGLVSLSGGLKIVDDGIALNTGSGIEVVDNKVSVKLGSGVQFDADGAIAATLLFDIESQIED